MQLTINVTEEDIQAGKPGCYTGCAIALAAERTFRENRIPLNLHGVALASKRILATTPAFIYCSIPLSEEAINFGYTFDTFGDSVLPISFVVDVDYD